MKVNKYFYNMLQQPHLLIAGATGAGKSVLLHNLIDIILLLEDSSIILIDTKKVELYELKNSINTLEYADTVQGAKIALNNAINIMDSRFKALRLKGLKKLENKPIYIIVDEFADLVLSGDKEITKQTIKISQLGRAANIHLILATQRPTADVINKKIMVNITARVCLRVACAIDSRNVIGMSGGELLPTYGRGIYWVDGYTYNIEIPLPQPHTIMNKKSDFNNKYIFYFVLILLLLFFI